MKWLNNEPQVIEIKQKKRRMKPRIIRGKDVRDAIPKRDETPSV